jgi:hypothetical protein
MPYVPLENMPSVLLGIVLWRKYTFICPKLAQPEFYLKCAGYFACTIGELKE